MEMSKTHKLKVKEFHGSWITDHVHNTEMVSTCTWSKGVDMFVPPSAIKLILIHSWALSMASFVASSMDEENIEELPLKAIMLKVSNGLSFERAAKSAIFAFAMGPPCMLALLSTKNTTSFLKIYKNNTIKKDRHVSSTKNNLE